MLPVSRRTLKSVQQTMTSPQPTRPDYLRGVPGQEGGDDPLRLLGRGREVGELRGRRTRGLGGGRKLLLARPEVEHELGTPAVHAHVAVVLGQLTAERATALLAHGHVTCHIRDEDEYPLNTIINSNLNITSFSLLIQPLKTGKVFTPPVFLGSQV